MTTTGEPTPTFRDLLITRLVPPWLRRGNAERVLYALGVQCDALADALVAGIKMRFPGYYTDESLPLIGAERRIARGRSETSVQYATRLTRWLIDHRRRGGPYAMLAQIWAHYAPATFPVTLVYRSGRRYQMAVDGTVTRSDIAWTPDDRPEQWARWWLTYAMPAPLPLDNTWDSDPSPTWNEPNTTGLTVWNYAIALDTINDIRSVPREWNAAHCRGTILLIDELWDLPADRLWDEPGTWDVGAGRSAVRIQVY